LEGGKVVGEGTPEVIAGLPTATGRALRAATVARAAEPGKEGGDAAFALAQASGPDAIRVLGARENNLRGVSLEVPRNQLVVVTGVSGSGKSTLAFDVLYAEGQRRFLDCLPTYVRQFVRPLGRPEVDRVEGIPPTVALEQKLSHASSMSTVGTASEVYHYLRLLFAFCGVARCPGCGVSGEVVSAPERIAARIAEHFPDGEIWLLAPLIRKRKGLHREVLAAAEKRGVHQVRIDGVLWDVARAPPLDRHTVHDIEAVADIVPAGPERQVRLQAAVVKTLQLSGKSVLVTARGESERFYSTARACPACGSGLPVADPRLFTFSQKFGACPVCEGRGEAPGEIEDQEEDGGGVRGGDPCLACRGTRLRPEALAMEVQGRSIGQVAALSVREARGFLRDLGDLSAELEEAVMPELHTRLRVLDELGLGYLTLDRGAHTLSTGEGQRVRVVAQLASNLRGVCYVLDEPTVGLHPRDSQALARALFGLRDRGNTVVVVEHEEALIRAADHLVDLGPGAGAEGGSIVARGTPAEVARVEASVTGSWLRGAGQRPPWPRRPLACERVRVLGAGLHNLRDLTVEFPLGRLTCVTGVSGSGKSTLVRHVLFRALKARLSRGPFPPGVRGLEGWQAVSRALEVDEAPVGRTPRSVPATYVDIMSHIRALFAATPDARARGYKAARFSFNVAAGRCDECEGQGRIKVTMALLPEVYIPCGSCSGRRYNPDTLAVTYKGKSIAEVLALTVAEARELFAAVSQVRTRLDFLAEIGLSYLHLGQPSPTLSGGEAQRMKLAAELATPGQGHSLYVLDEPTTGLHLADVARLVTALHRLVGRGDTVVVIEHNVDVMAAADCVVDLGPEGGAGGGELVAWGTPEEVARVERSRTASFLRAALGRAPARLPAPPDSDSPITGRKTLSP
jgi:excinuclease ABC subunit A